MSEPSRGRSAFPFLLMGVGLLFVGILVFVYMVTRGVDPGLLDEKGRPVQTQRR